MAKNIQSNYIFKHKVRRKGVHAKSKASKLKSSKFTLIKLSHKTVVNGETSEVIEVSVTESGILPSLK